MKFQTGLNINTTSMFLVASVHFTQKKHSTIDLMVYYILEMNVKLNFMFSAKVYYICLDVYIS